MNLATIIILNTWVFVAFCHLPSLDTVFSASEFLESPYKPKPVTQGVLKDILNLFLGGGSGGGRPPKGKCTERDVEYFGTQLNIRNNGPRNKVSFSLNSTNRA